jgi:uncharacterized small protein (DUF1192 family)
MPEDKREREGLKDIQAVAHEEHRRHIEDHLETERLRKQIATLKAEIARLKGEK